MDWVCLVMTVALSLATAGAGAAGPAHKAWLKERQNKNPIWRALHLIDARNSMTWTPDPRRALSPILVLCGEFRHGKEKCSSALDRSFGPHSAPVRSDYPLDRGQADAGAVELLG
jgi:hypothetical protein